MAVHGNSNDCPSNIINLKWMVINLHFSKTSGASKWGSMTNGESQSKKVVFLGVE